MTDSQGLRENSWVERGYREMGLDWEKLPEALSLSIYLVGERNEPRGERWALFPALCVCRGLKR